VDAEKKELKRNYLRARRPMGVFLIRNLTNEKVFLAVGVDLQGLLNRHKFELKAGSHKNRELQSDWNDLGADRFAFEILDQMEPRDDATESRKDLASLKQLWLEKLRPYGERGYNEPEITRAERLRQIAARRSR
jgi:hypothetical protein